MKGERYEKAVQIRQQAFAIPRNVNENFVMRKVDRKENTCDRALATFRLEPTFVLEVATAKKNCLSKRKLSVSE